MQPKVTIQPSLCNSFSRLLTWMKLLVAMTKPGIIGGNIITALAGFSFGVQHTISIPTLLGMIAGTAFIIASASVLNNYIDRDIDSLMQRTQHRLLLHTSLTPLTIILYAIALLLVGSLLLYFGTNILTLTLALTGFIVYLGPYTLWLKRRSHWSTLLGSISGALPPVIGYSAASGQIDSHAVYLFIMLAAWQMPHFMAISLYRLDDFNRAGVPTVPQSKGIGYTQYSMLCWLSLFIVALCPLYFIGHINGGVFILMLCSGFFWLGYGLWKKVTHMPAKRWGRQMFLISLLVIFIISGLLCVNVYWK